jgi:serine/threonine protein kinase
VQRIGKYEILKELGRGATSVVFLAQDAFANRQVAIKLVRPEVLNHPEHGKRFQRLFLTEASLAGKLQHPHIVSIYDAVADEQGSYIVMEYVEGGTLEQYCHNSTLLSLGEVVEIIFKCSKALDFAHQHGVIHRDIKPANILMSSVNQIKISDFGAAVNMTSDATQVSGIGSPAYMSPEQLQEGRPSHQTDIYSLGVVLYQLLTGRLPFNANNSYSMVHQILNVEAAPPSTQRDGIPTKLDKVVKRAMAKNMARRYPTWDEFADDLGEVFNNLHLPELSVSDSEKFNTMRRLEFFKSFSDVDLWQVLSVAQWVRFKSGALILREGDIGTSFFIIALGEVKVTQKSKLLNILKKGECFGEMAYLGKHQFRRSASVVAANDLVVIEITADALAKAAPACRVQFNGAFLELLVNRLESANTRLSSLLLDRNISIF